VTHHPPPRLGAAILARLADRNEPLAGDILEGYQLRRSHLWFWRELIGAILNGSFRESSEVRPIKLVEFPSLAPLREDFAAKRARLQTLGLSASPVSGVSGWTIFALVYLITVVEPLLWFMLSVGLLAGLAIGIARVKYRNRHHSSPYSDLRLERPLLLSHRTR
jgi:hypothetical protein